MASVAWCVIVLLVIVDRMYLVVGCDYGLSLSCPGTSCADIYHNNPKTHGISGQYVIKTSSDHYILVYCDMDLECGGEKGWMKVTNINVTKGDSCPSGWNKTTSPIAACTAPSKDAGCYSTHFSTHSVPYRRVCGMIVGYQKGTPDAFAMYYQPSRSINGPYVDGVSITYGTTRKHVWTYAIGQSDMYNRSSVNCPCAEFPGKMPPSFVHENYYCESGSLSQPKRHSYFTTDPVWDGKNCTLRNNCCSDPSLPWFYRQIPLTANSDIEARICRDEEFTNEGVLVGELQLYVQ